MNVGFNPHVAPQSHSPRGPQTQTTPPVPNGSDGGVTVTLSKAAQNVLKNSGSGNSANSPAHMAAAAAGDHIGPFGQLVKTFAPGHQMSGAVPNDGGDTVPGDTTDTGGTTETGDGGTTDGDNTTVTDGSDGTGDTGTTEGGDTTVVAAPEESDGTGETAPTIVVEEPDITELLGGSATTDGETSEIASGSAGSDDPVASTGDSDTTTGGAIGDAGEPVAMVNTGEAVGELLDLLDDNSEEIV